METNSVCIACDQWDKDTNLEWNEQGNPRHKVCEEVSTEVHQWLDKNVTRVRTINDVPFGVLIHRTVGKVNFGTNGKVYITED